MILSKKSTSIERNNTHTPLQDLYISEQKHQSGQKYCSYQVPSQQVKTYDAVWRSVNK
jgi:hypothetical protein